MIIKGYTDFGPFRGRALSDFGGAFGGAWEDWCDQGGAATYGKGAKGVTACKYGGGWAVNPFPAPWTDIGKLSRVAAIGAWPSPDDLDPERLVRITVDDPAYFAYMVGLSHLIAIGMPLLGPVAAVLQVAGIAGVQQSPFFKTLSLIALSSPFPMGSYVENIGLNPAGWALAIKLSYDRGVAEGRPDPWSRPWENILEPLLKDKLEQVQALIAGNAALVAYAIRKEARTLPDSNVKAVLLAIGDAGNLGLIADFQNFDPKKEKIYLDIGDALANRVANAVPAFRDTLVIIGRALIQFATPLSMVAAGNPHAGEAFLEAATGVNISTFTNIGVKIDAAKSQSGANIAMVNAIVAAVDAIVKAIGGLLDGPLGKSIISGDGFKKLQSILAELVGNHATPAIGSALTGTVATPASLPAVALVSRGSIASTLVTGGAARGTTATVAATVAANPIAVVAQSNPVAATTQPGSIGVSATVPRVTATPNPIAAPAAQAIQQAIQQPPAAAKPASNTGTVLAIGGALLMLFR